MRLSLSACSQGWKGTCGRHARVWHERGVRMTLRIARSRFRDTVFAVVTATTLALVVFISSNAARLRAQVSPTNQPDFSSFAGSWGSHGFGITVGTNGDALAQWRVYSWCDETAPPGPCDTVLAGQGNDGGKVVDLIEDGGLAQTVFSGVSNGSAYGVVVESTVPDFLEPGGSVTLTLLPYDMALLMQGATSVTLCGPNFAQQAPPDVVASGPCGA